MSMNYDGTTSTCWNCGYSARGNVSQCPQCRQIELQEKQNKILERQVSGGASGESSGSSLIGWAIMVTLGFAVVLWVIELVNSFFRWVGKLLSSLWNSVTYPFKYVYHSFLAGWTWWQIALAFIFLIWFFSLFSGDGAKLNRADKKPTKKRSRKSSVNRK